MVMLILALNIYLVLQEFLRAEPLTASFEAALLLSYIGDILIKSNPHYSAQIFRRIRIIKSLTQPYSPRASLFYHKNGPWGNPLKRITPTVIQL